MSHTGGAAVAQSARKIATERGFQIWTTATSIMFPSLDHMREKENTGEHVSGWDNTKAAARDVGSLIDPTGVIIPSTRDKEEQKEAADQRSMEADQMGDHVG